MNDTVYHWFTEQPSRYWLVAVPFAAFLLVAALLPRRAPAWVFLVCLAVCLLAFRWPVVVAGAENNVDESQLIAGAITLQYRPVFWRDVDAHAIGPLAIYPLTILGKMGVVLDYETARLFGLLVEWTGLAAIYRLMRETSGESWARLGILPLVAFFALTREQDFLQYSAETMAGALLALGLAGLWIGLRRRTIAWQAAGAFLLGLTAWAKLQALPVALVLIIGGCWVRAFGRGEPGRDRWATAMAAGFLAALAIPLLLIAAAGVWTDWSDAYVRAGLSYLGETKVGFWEGLQWLLTEPSTGFPFYALPLFALTLIFGHTALRKDPSLSPLAWVLAAAGLVAMVTILRPGRLFAHYVGLALWLPVLPAAACIAAALPEATLQRRGWQIGVVTGWLVCTLGPQIGHLLSPQIPSLRFPPGVNHLIVNDAAFRILEQGRIGDTLSVWGWKPRIYVMTGLPQATREAHTERLIEPNPLREFYRARFLADFQRTPPTFFIDAITPDDAIFNDRRRHGFELWPDLARLIAVDYYLLESVGGYRVFRRIDRKG